MDDKNILALIEREEQNAYGINDAELSDARAESIKYYLGEPFGNEIEGRSQVVSTDTQDVIESSLPQLLKVFVAGDKVVVFDPRGPEDVDAAEQETEYINHIVMEKNHGFHVFYVWFKDALLSKNGYVKVWYEKYEDVEEEFYQGLTDAQVNMLVQDGVEVLQHSAYPDPSFPAELAQQAQMMIQAGMDAPQIPQLHDVKIRKTEPKGCVKICNVAPEAMMVSTETPGLDLNEARFVQHRELMSLDQAKAMGFDVSEDTWSDVEDFYQEADARDLYGEDSANLETTDVLVKDTYYKIDGKRMRYVVIGNTIVHEEEVDIVPFACLSPIVMPHRHIGRSYADLVKDIQLIKSTLIRGSLDAMYLANSPRFAISDRVNLEDMLVSRPGGLVRVAGDPNGAILPLVSPGVSPNTFNMVEYMDAAKEKRTGVTAYNQGLDANSLNKTATGISIIAQASQERLLLVARLFAETGVKDLFMLVHRLTRKHQDKAEVVRLRNEWVEVDPRQWKTRTDMSISVGLGTGNKDQQLMHLQTILMAQKEGLQIGVATPKNVYNALIKLTQNAGFKDAEEFWTSPEESQQEPQPDPEMVKVQNQQQVDQAKLQLEQQKSAAQLQLEREKTMAQMELEQWKAQQSAELEKYKAEIKAQSEIELNRTKMEMQAGLESSRMMMDCHKQDMQTLMDRQMMANESQQSSGENMHKMLESLASVMEQLSKPRKVVRDARGRVQGIE